MSDPTLPSSPERGELHAQLFANIVMQQAGMTMIFLGVTPHPETGETMFDLEGAQHFKLNGPPNFDRKLGVNEYMLTDPMMKVFRDQLAAFLKKHPEINIAPTTLEEQMTWARHRIRYEVLLAAYGADKAQQAMNDTDAQLQKAVTELPNAAALAEKARRARNVSSK